MSMRRESKQCSAGGWVGERAALGFFGAVDCAPHFFGEE
jgi:hypothetical protein